MRKRLKQLSIVLIVLANVSLLPLLVIGAIRWHHLRQPVPITYDVSKLPTIAIKGPINPLLDSKTAKLKKLVKAGAKEVVILIDSPGGTLRDGQHFIDMMHDAQQYGTKFTCIVDGKAMSMALIIFSECDIRYATFGSKLMWHSIALAGFMRINEMEANRLLLMMLVKNDEVWSNTRIHFLPWYFSEHFIAESVLSASELERTGIRYLRVIQNVKLKAKPKRKKGKKNGKKSISIETKRGTPGKIKRTRPGIWSEPKGHRSTVH
jgi:ATP-dependent protease ClpP protease subunit